MCKCRLAWGVVLVCAGVLFAANALVSGPRAFGGGWMAVAAMCVCGAVLVAVGILAAIGTGLLTALNTNYKATRILDEQVTAVNLATTYFEAIKTMPYADTYPNAEDIITVPTQYNVNIDIDFTSDSYPDDGITWVDTSTDETLQRITVTISREGGEPVLSMCAFKTKRVEN